MIRNILKITSFIALLPTIALPLVANAAVKNYSNTWFEIEVILFSQIDDKSQLQEVFPETSNIPTPNGIIDLLGPYLDPNIANLKNRVSVCSEFLSNNGSTFSNNTFNIKYPAFDQFPQASLINNNFANSVINDNEIEILASEDTAEQAIQANAQQYAFSSFNVPKEFCIVPEEFFEEYKQDNPNFVYNETPLTNIPALISGEEDFTTDRPYFINETSLELKDIVKQLKRSRNFKPLLHMGWRQITKSKNEAIPLKLYAGENLMQPYNEALTRYKKALLLEEQNALELTNNDSLKSINESVINTNEAALQNKITTILQQAKINEPTIEEVLNNLNTGPNELVTPISNSFATGIDNTATTPLIEPQKPPQTWTIDGFLKVEVDHFLHITADFNVINMSLAEQATQQLVSQEPVTLKSMHFEQNKRVRSKEIHYFDHPYMGMIIQIRRHDQTPPVEDIVEDIKDTQPTAQ